MDSKWLIQGMDFTESAILGVPYKQGAVREIIQGAIINMWSGIIYTEGKDSKTLVGEIHDEDGGAQLIRVLVSAANLSFTKTYDDNLRVVHYKFRPIGKHWIGTYEMKTYKGLDLGDGKSSCILTEVTHEFFYP